MGYIAHLKELENKHAALENEIKNELKHPKPDIVALSTLKKKKLQLKDQIQAYKNR